MEPREKSKHLLIDGFIRKQNKEYDSNIPSDIISIIFMFFVYVKFEHGKRVNIKGNTITNIDTTYASSSNITLIDEWMDPDSDYHQSHTITVKFIKGQQIADSAFCIGIVYGKYYVNHEFLDQEYKGTWITSNGKYYSRTPGKRYHFERFNTYFGDGDVVSMTLGIKAFTLSYQIHKDEDIIKRTLYSGNIIKAKYKWAISISAAGDSCQILDIIHSN